MVVGKFTRLYHQPSLPFHQYILLLSFMSGSLFKRIFHREKSDTKTSKTKLAADTFKQISLVAESAVDGTPFAIPLKVINRVIDIHDVR